jgi:hypothetical protein
VSISPTLACVVVAGILAAGFASRTNQAAPTIVAAAPAKGHVPCSFRTPGMQHECVDDSGHLQPAGPAAARQEKYFDECVAHGGSDYKCLDKAAKVK